MKFLTIPNILRLLLPMILGFIFNLFPNCIIKKSSGSSVKFRPPSFVFGIIWPILYICLGLAWIYTIHTNTYNINPIIKDIIFILINVSLNSWILNYACLSKKVWGIYSLFLSILIIIIALHISPLISRLLLTPLLTWIILATTLNISEVQKL